LIRSRLVRIGGGVGALLAVLWLILSSAFPSNQETACAPVSGMAVVQEVIDGDTVQLVSGERIRYLGIDTPEVRTKRDGRWIYAPEPFAEDASALNRRLVEGRRVRLEADREPCDRFRRHLAYLFVDDLFVNAELVRQGLAVVKIHPPNDKYRSQLQDAQAGAQAHRTGLWAAGHFDQRAGHGVDQGAGRRARPAAPGASPES
jgi:micrococcal nuclease